MGPDVTLALIQNTADFIVSFFSNWNDFVLYNELTVDEN